MGFRLRQDGRAVAGCFSLVILALYLSGFAFGFVSGWLTSR
jgi:hypothetical protein